MNEGWCNLLSIIVIVILILILIITAVPFSIVSECNLNTLVE